MATRPSTRPIPDPHVQVEPVCSQPSAVVLLQSLNPALQTIRHVPPLHIGDAFTAPAGRAHGLSQALQLASELCVLISQPSEPAIIRSPLQSAYPKSHVGTQSPPTHVARMLSPETWHTLVVSQPPQCMGSFAVLTSQPLPAIASQSA